MSESTLPQTELQPTIEVALPVAPTQLEPVSENTTVAESVSESVLAVENSIPGPTIEDSPTDPDRAERRASARQVSKAVFAIAPYRPEVPLTQSNFVVVRGRNVNRTGVGLLSVAPYLEPQIVVAMGAPGLKPIYILSTVTHCTEVGEHQGIKLYLIGCKFVERLAK